MSGPEIETGNWENPMLDGSAPATNLGATNLDATDVSDTDSESDQGGEGGAKSFEEHHAIMLSRLTQLFSSIDQDNDGKLSKTEVSERLVGDDTLEALMLLAGKSYKETMRQLDLNSDGAITLDEFFAILGSQGTTYTIGWLEEQIAFNQQTTEKLNMLPGSDVHLGTPSPAWAIVFEVFCDEDDFPTDTITQETVEVCDKLWHLSLSVEMRRSLDCKEVIILVGIPFAVMQEEAEEMSLQMRLKMSRGTMPYTRIHHEQFRTYRHHVTSEDQEPEEAATELEPASPNTSATRKLFSGKSYDSTFLSAHHQVAISNRLTRNGMDLWFRMSLPEAHSLLKRQRKLANHKGAMRCFQLRELLTAAGGFRVDTAEKMGDEIALLAKQVAHDPFFTCYHPDFLDGGSQKDHSAVTQTHAMHLHMDAAGLPLVKYTDIENVLDSLDRYFTKPIDEKIKNGEVVREAVEAGPGESETFVGSLMLVIPVHNEQELTHLRLGWGTWNHAWTFRITAYPMEGGKLTIPSGHRDFKKQQFSLGFLYQPLDEIRDYFGEETALYFSWLGTYTRALMGLSAFGMVAMLTQFTVEPQHGTPAVDANPLTLYYSIYLSVWSILFLSMWKRRENEHAFLWGTEGFESAEGVRAKFKGELVINEETGEEHLQYATTVRATIVRLLVKALIVSAIMFCMCSTVYGALVAVSLKNRAPQECNIDIDVEKSDYGCALTDPETCCYCTSMVHCPNYVHNSSLPDEAMIDEIPNDRTVQDSAALAALSMYDKLFWVVLSSVLNLTIIVSAGAIYEAIADYLNDLENFRTNTAYDDGLIIKNFLFQFVNNYFILFYIAYLRQIEFRGVKKQCAQSCLGELQLQMLVVFTGKTFGLQFVELAKPFVVQKLHLFMEMSNFNSVTSHVTSATSTVVHGAVGAVGKGTGRVAYVVSHAVLDDATLNELGYNEDTQASATARAELVAKQGARQLADVGHITDPFELQTHMVNYEDKGTFDDFNEMAIQYGYIALFSPCMPLAPFFALLNNVFEIRGDAWKLCKGYQRPTAQKREDIGSWYTVLNFLGFVAVCTNATMIAFVGSQAAKTEEERSGIQQRLDSAHLWTQAVAIEHGVMLCRVCLLIFLPTYPAWINDAKEVLRFRIAEMGTLAKAKIAGDEKSVLIDAGATLEEANMFINADKDNNFRITKTEYIQHFGGSGEEFEKADKNRDGTVDAAEFSANGMFTKKSAQPRAYT